MPRPRLIFEPLYYSSTLEKDYPSDMLRAKVPGGWLVFYRETEGIFERPNLLTSTMCFYPDPDHSWDGTSLP